MCVPLKERMNSINLNMGATVMMLHIRLNTYLRILYLILGWFHSSISSESVSCPKLPIACSFCK